ncbi:Fic family protein [Phytohabitans kaempferiae]|uniref:Fic family protein n=1 Tax=Phytohabitans kaempferiae TaxID=1620943 RepID=A0ABV6LX01_9ACTN
MGRWQEAVWVPDLSAPGGRRARQPFTYRAYIPDLLDPAALSFSAATTADIAEAEAAIAVADHGHHLVAMETLARLLLRSESVASSRIEGLECSQRRLAEAAFAPEHAGETARQVLANIDAMRRAIDIGACEHDLTVDHIRSMHALLMREDRATGRFAGEFRTRQNWIGGRGDSPRDAAFIPPPPEHVEPLMADLVAFINRDDLPTVAQAAVAHAQFETIHPFLDGNGRVGRCLIHTVFARRHLASRILVPVSLVLAAYGDHYIQGLVDFREGQVDQWCGTFASAARLAVDGAGLFEERLAAMISRWRLESEARPGSHLWRACEQTTITPVFTVTSLRDDLGSSSTATTEAIERLEKIGIVAQVSLGRRNRVYLNRAVLRLLDDFERDLLSTADGTAGRLRTSARAKTAIPPALLPSVEHTLLESFPVGAQSPPTTAALATISGYRPDEVRAVLDRLAADDLVEPADPPGWLLTAKGHQLRSMLRANEDLRD